MKAKDSSRKKMKQSNFNIVLVEPEIPQNTGNIVRLCACTSCELFLVGKLGFILDDKRVKRSGLDYWDCTKIHRYDSLEDLQIDYADSNFYYLTTKVKKRYSDAVFKNGDFFVFGPETRGLNEELLKKNHESCLTIPMAENQRSLNLSNSVAIVVYEGIRQTNCL